MGIMQHKYDGCQQCIIMQRFLYIHLNHLHIRTNRDIQSQYLSFFWHDWFYFSNSYSNNQIDNFSITLNHSLLLPVPQEQVLVKSVMLQIWQNHMILFEHEVDISELNTRNGTRKKLQILQGQILEFSIHLLQPNEILVGQTSNESVLQHFIVINSIKTEESSTDTGPSYFKVEYSEGEINVPVVNSVAMIPLPTTFRFWHIKNGKPLSSSKFFRSEDVKSLQMKVEMIGKEESGYDIDVKMERVTNLWRNRIETSALLEAHDILLSDIQIKFQAKDTLKGDIRPEQFSNTKFKITAGNKAFDLNGDLDPIKPTRFARIVYFIVKSQEEDFTFTLEKGPKIIAKATIGTDELLSYHPNALKRKLLDPLSGRAVATVKCRGEKAKNLSLPQNNVFWKSCNQSKIPAMMLQFSQVSLWGVGEACGIIIKTEDDEVLVPDVPDFSVFKLQTELPQHVNLTIKQEGNVYLKLVPPQPNKDDFIGMAVINPKDLRLGAVPITLPFYKQKELICEARMIVNKVMPWPFVKGVPHSESLTVSGAKAMSLSVMLKTIELTSYYWSYLYQGKGDLYCIVQLNKVKKVVILEKMASTQKLMFLSATGSDLLNFLVDYQQSFKVKFTVLATDEGVEEEIYGTTQKRVKTEDMNQRSIIFQKQPLANSYSLHVGQLDFQIQKGLIGQFKRAPVKKELNQVKQNLQKINKSIERVEKKMGNPQQKQKQEKDKKRYQSLVLPEIRDPKQQRLKRLAKVLQAQAREHRPKKPSVHLTSIEPEQERHIDRKSRARSQGMNGPNLGGRQEIEYPLRPHPLPVREEIESQNEKYSQLKAETPQNQFDQNEFFEAEIRNNQKEPSKEQDYLEDRQEL